MGKIHSCNRKKQLILFYFIASIGFTIGLLISFYNLIIHNYSTIYVLFVIVYSLLITYSLMKYYYSKKYPIAELYPNYVIFYISPFRKNIQLKYDNIEDIEYTDKQKIKIHYQMENKTDNIKIKIVIFYKYQFDFPEESFNALKESIRIFKNEN